MLQTWHASGAIKILGTPVTRSSIDFTYLRTPKGKKNTKVSKIRRRLFPSQKYTAYGLFSLVRSLLQGRLFFAEFIFPAPSASTS
jgi:hypothetical protein